MKIRRPYILTGIASIGIMFILAASILRSAPDSERARTARERVLPLLEPELRENNLESGQAVFLRTFKAEKELELWMRPKKGERYVLFKTYSIANWGRGALGPKFAEGDGQAPEGFYHVAPRQLNPNSRYHLSFDLGFPNAFDRHHGRTGSFLMVHGGSASIGCYAMTDPGIEEIYSLVAAALNGGQRFVRVHCLPFRMTAQNMAKHSGEFPEHLEFWENLKKGSDIFEKDNQPPDASVNAESGRYVFRSEGD